MGGGLLQLVALGAQDAYLSGRPEITFWKGLFKRHTNFAMEPFRINFSGQSSWGTKQSAIINRNADLLYSTYLEVHLPHYDATLRPTAVYNNDQFRLGYNLLKYVELEIGGQLIDRQYGEFLYLWETLSTSADQGLLAHQMVGAQGRPQATSLASTLNTTVSAGQQLAFKAPAGCTPGGVSGQSQPGHPNIIYVPLRFFYTRNPGLALPLIALQYHEVKINILWNDNQSISGDYNSVPVPAQPASASIYIDYIYLDVDERRRMATEQHEYLIEQVQYNEDKGLTAYSNRIDLTFNHPVKELVWVVQPTCYRNCKIPIPGAPGGPSAAAGGARIGGGSPNNQYRLTPLTYDQTAVYQQYLQFNGTDRLDKRYGDYFNKVQPFQHHTSFPGTAYLASDFTSAGQSTQYVVQMSGATGPSGPIGGASTGMSGAYYDVGVLSSTSATNSVMAQTSQPGIYMYSFALKPEEHQPSGTCNFSKIDTATLVLQLSGDITINQQQDATWDVRVYAINYNILRIMNGMAGLAYAS
jgi:hypothetical protein